MYTYDEWGNSVLHIQTGREGMKLLKEAGLRNTMTDEEYKKHMDSYRRIKEKENKQFQERLDKFLEWCKS